VLVVHHLMLGVGRMCKTLWLGHVIILEQSPDSNAGNAHAQHSAAAQV
jgi:hypothetical protein